jgi:hypothetical protein
MKNNTIDIQYRDDNSGETVADIFGLVSVRLAAYENGKTIYTSDELGYTKFVTNESGDAKIELADVLMSNMKMSQIFSGMYGKKYSLGIRLTISTQATEYYKPLVQILNLTEVEWFNKPFEFNGINYVDKNGSFYLGLLADRVTNVKELVSKVKESELNYLEAKAIYEAEVKSNVDLELDRSADYEPPTFRNIVTRILEFQKGTLLPAIEYTKIAKLESEQKRLDIVNNIFNVLLQSYPDITIKDGEGMPYMDGKLEEYPIEK